MAAVGHLSYDRDYQRRGRVVAYMSPADVRMLDRLADERDLSRSSVARELLHRALVDTGADLQGAA